MTRHRIYYFSDFHREHELFGHDYCLENDYIRCKNSLVGRYQEFTEIPCLKWIIWLQNMNQLVEELDSADWDIMRIHETSGWGALRLGVCSKISKVVSDSFWNLLEISLEALKQSFTKWAERTKANSKALKLNHSTWKFATRWKLRARNAYYHHPM